MEKQTKIFIYSDTFFTVLHTANNSFSRENVKFKDFSIEDRISYFWNASSWNVSVVMVTVLPVCEMCCQLLRIKVRNSSRVLGSSLNTPSMVLVTVRLFDFWTPLITIHICLKVKTTTIYRMKWHKVVYIFKLVYYHFVYVLPGDTGQLPCLVESLSLIYLTFWY